MTTVCSKNYNRIKKQSFSGFYAECILFFLIFVSYRNEFNYGKIYQSVEIAHSGFIG